MLQAAVISANSGRPRETFNRITGAIVDAAMPSTAILGPASWRGYTSKSASERT